MQRIFGGVIAGVLVLVLIIAGWYYRPWSPYSPARITALDSPEMYPQTFQRMDTILPSRTIHATRPEPAPEDIAPLEVSYVWNGETRSLDEFVANSDTLSIVVLRDGVLVGEDYWQGSSDATRFTSWSVAKSFVATLIAMGLRDGLIASLDDTVETYVPEFEGTAYGETSLRHLLMMSAGVDFNEDYRDTGESDIRPFFFNSFIMGQNPDHLAAAIERNRMAGRDLHYVSPNSHVLSAVVRAVYDDRLAPIVEAQIWGPLGMSADASWLQNLNSDRGIALGYCCLQATTRDFARFGQFYLQDGVWDGQRLLPEGWVMEATRPNAPFQNAGPDGPYAPRGYGLHFWVPPDHDGEYFAAGVYGQYIWVDERRGVVIAVNAGDASWGERGPEAYQLFRAIAEHVSPLAERTPRSESAQDAPAPVEAPAQP